MRVGDYTIKSFVRGRVWAIDVIRDGQTIHAEKVHDLRSPGLHNIRALIWVLKLGIDDCPELADVCALLWDEYQDDQRL